MRLYKRFARRHLAIVCLSLVSLVVAACGSSSSESNSAQASGAKPLSIQNIWVKGDTSLAGVWLAAARGYFAKAGVDPVIAPSDGTLDPRQLVLAGQADAGIDSLTAILQAKAQGAPVKLLGCEYQRSPLTIIGLKSAGINSFHDLIGKKIGVYPTDVPLITAWLAANGISASQVHFVTTATSIAPLLAHRIDALEGYATHEVLILQKMHVAITPLSASDNNFPLPDYCLFTTAANVTKYGPLFKAFMAASAKGWQLAKTSPAAAVNAVLALQSGATRAETTQEIKADMSGYIQSDTANPTPVWTITAQQVDAVSRHLVQVGALKKVVTAAQVLDTSFLPRSN